MEILNGQLEIPTHGPEQHTPIPPLIQTMWAQGLERVGTPQTIHVDGAPVDIDAPRWNFLRTQHIRALERVADSQAPMPKAEWQRRISNQRDLTPQAIRDALQAKSEWERVLSATRRQWGTLTSLVEGAAARYGIHSTDTQSRMRDHWAHHPGVYRLLRKHIPQLQVEYHAAPWNATGVFEYYGSAYPEDCRLGALGTAQEILGGAHLGGVMNAMFDDTPKKPGQLHETVMLAKEAAEDKTRGITLILTIPSWEEAGYAFMEELKHLPRTVGRKLWTFKKGQYCFRHGAAEAGWKERYSHANWNTDLWVISNEWESIERSWDALQADLLALQSYLAAPTMEGLTSQAKWCQSPCIHCASTTVIGTVGWRSCTTCGMPQRDAGAPAMKGMHKQYWHSWGLPKPGVARRWAASDASVSEGKRGKWAVIADLPRRGVDAPVRHWCGTYERAASSTEAEGMAVLQLAREVAPGSAWLCLTDSMGLIMAAAQKSQSKQKHTRLGAIIRELRRTVREKDLHLTTLWVQGHMRDQEWKDEQADKYEEALREVDLPEAGPPAVAMEALLEYRLIANAWADAEAERAAGSTDTPGPLLMVHGVDMTPVSEPEVLERAREAVLNKSAHVVWRKLLTHLLRTHSMAHQVLLGRRNAYQKLIYHRVWAARFVNNPKHVDPEGDASPTCPHCKQVARDFAHTWECRHFLHETWAHNDQISSELQKTGLPIHWAMDHGLCLVGVGDEEKGWRKAAIMWHMGVWSDALYRTAAQEAKVINVPTSRGRGRGRKGGLQQRNMRQTWFRILRMRNEFMARKWRQWQEAKVSTRRPAWEPTPQPSNTAMEMTRQLWQATWRGWLEQQSLEQEERQPLLQSWLSAAQQLPGRWADAAEIMIRAGAWEAHLTRATRRRWVPRRQCTHAAHRGITGGAGILQSVYNDWGEWPTATHGEEMLGALLSDDPVIREWLGIPAGVVPVGDGETPPVEDPVPATDCWRHEDGSVRTQDGLRAPTASMVRVTAKRRDALIRQALHQVSNQGAGEEETETSPGRGGRRVVYDPPTWSW